MNDRASLPVVNGPEGEAPVTRVVRALLAEDRSLILSARDIALLVLLRQYLDSRNDPSPFLADVEIRGVSGRLDDIEGDRAPGFRADKRATELINRLLAARCLLRADMNRLAVEGEAEYQITALGDGIAQWQQTQAEFSGARLQSILALFNDTLLAIAAEAEVTGTVEEWKSVETKVTHALKDVLGLVQKHQGELDQRHEALRDFIPAMLRENSEHSIGQCREQIERVYQTILDLHRVTLTTVNASRDYLLRIEEAGTAGAFPKAEELCMELNRHLDAIVRWTEQRYADWVQHYRIVHDFLRTVVGVHRQRRITDALKRAVTAEPNWSLAAADECIHYSFRSELLTSKAVAEAPRRAKAVMARKVDDMREDDLPRLLEAWLKEEMAAGGAYLTRLMRRAEAAGKPLSLVIFHVPWLMGQMVAAGKVDRHSREWAKIADDVQAQEFNVTP